MIAGAYRQHPGTKGGTSADPMSKALAEGGVASVTSGTGVEGNLTWFVTPSHEQFRVDLRRQFQELADKWHDETSDLSSPSQIAMHPAYQQIMAMGSAAISLILEDLSTRGGQWYWALKYLTGASPVPRDAAGKTRVVAEAWIQWGRRMHYLL